jgi:hypothetical protein
MPAVTYQTIRLSKGKHASPEDGARVMERASMLAGEAFSDHPGSVSPAIGAFLRGYNDLIDDFRRQDLYAYAANVLGTMAGPSVERARPATPRMGRRAEQISRFAPLPARGQSTTPRLSLKCACRDRREVCRADGQIQLRSRARRGLDADRRTDRNRRHAEIFHADRRIRRDEDRDPRTHSPGSE